MSKLYITDGEPDVGSIHENIRRLKAERERCIRDRDALAARCAELADAMRQLRDADLEARSTESPQRAAQIVEGAWLAVDRALDRPLPESAARIERIVEAAREVEELHRTYPRVAGHACTCPVCSAVRAPDLCTALAPEKDQRRMT